MAIDKLIAWNPRSLVKGQRFAIAWVTILRQFYCNAYLEILTEVTKQEAELVKQEAEAAKQRVQELAARLRELGIDPDDLGNSE